MSEPDGFRADKRAAHVYAERAVVQLLRKTVQILASPGFQILVLRPRHRRLRQRWCVPEAFTDSCVPGTGQPHPGADLDSERTERDYKP